MRRVVLFLAIIIFLLAVGISSGLLGINWQSFQLAKLPQVIQPEAVDEKVTVVSEESAIVSAVETVAPTVVTVGAERTIRIFDPFSFDPFDPFGIFRPRPAPEERIEQDIGSGFIVDEQGLIVTNKHVVSDINAKYKVITSDEKEYDVVEIFRDPANDLAILKINASNLKSIEMGDSDNLKVGQIVIAIGTPLGEFRGSVTKGIISGLGRGITAGDFLGRGREQLENVIQTDAAINPGNSGGPLVNLKGQVIGVNVAMAGGAQNIGFALPINLVQERLSAFRQSGGTAFKQAFLGISYRMISKEAALLNEVPEGAYVVEVLANSAAASAGIRRGDIITSFDDEKVRHQEGGLAELIAKKKVGDRVSIEIWRDGENIQLTVVLGEFSS